MSQECRGGWILVISRSVGNGRKAQIADIRRSAANGSNDPLRTFPISPVRAENARKRA